MENYLCILNLKGAAARVDIRSRESLFGTISRIYRIKLYHSLYTILFEDDNSVDRSMRTTNCVHHIHCDRILRVEDGEQKNTVWLLSTAVTQRTEL